MKNDDPAQVIGPREVRLIRTLPGPIERLWTYLTDPVKRGTWLAHGPMELRVGGAVELHFLHAHLSAEKKVPEAYKDMENGHTMKGKITRCEPPRVLAYTWGDEPGSKSEVTFELTSEGKNVRLVLTHRHLRDVEQMRSVASGWHAHLDVLLARLESAEPPLFWTAITRLNEDYARRIT